MSKASIKKKVVVSSGLVIHNKNMLGWTEPFIKIFWQAFISLEVKTVKSSDRDYR